MIGFDRFLLVVVLAGFLISPLGIQPAQSAQRHSKFTSQTVIAQFSDRVFQPEFCARRCRDNATCAAWSYESPPPRAPFGSPSTCYLLSHYERPVLVDPRFTSGIAEESLPGERFNYCVDILPSNFPPYMKAPVSVRNPGVCAAKCRSLSTCRAWTYHFGVPLGAPGALPLSSCSLSGRDPPLYYYQAGCLSGAR